MNNMKLGVMLCEAKKLGITHFKNGNPKNGIWNKINAVAKRNEEG